MIDDLLSTFFLFVFKKNQIVDFPNRKGYPSHLLVSVHLTFFISFYRVLHFFAVMCNAKKPHSTVFFGRPRIEKRLNCWLCFNCLNTISTSHFRWLYNFRPSSLWRRSRISFLCLWLSRDIVIVFWSFPFAQIGWNGHLVHLKQEYSLLIDQIHY